MNIFIKWFIILNFYQSVLSTTISMEIKSLLIELSNQQITFGKTLILIGFKGNIKYLTKVLLYYIKYYKIKKIYKLDLFLD
jgi:CheY-specific phosphatase CheX